MRVRFVAHASFEVEGHGRRIVCDPWFDGKVFNDAWALVTPPVDPSVLSGVDYIWLSHEHPDHFHMPTLRSIPEDKRAQLTLMYQAHASPRIVAALRKLGFSTVRELPLYRWHRLDDGIDVFCGSVGTMDSFLAIRSDGECVLNLNDCVLNVDQLAYVKRRIGPVSLLFTQFSFANWVGNAADELRGAQTKIHQLRDQIAILKPGATVPFASFSYFCNAENSRMNAWANTPATIASLGLEGVHFMYPGDTWDSRLGTFDSQRAVERYTLDYATRRRIDPSPAAVDADQLARAVDERLRATSTSVGRLFLRACAPCDIYIEDLGKVLFVDPPRRRFRITDATAELAQRARYVMCSQVAWYTFAFPWGPATTQVGGMFLDRRYAVQGPNRFFRVQNAIATEILRAGDRRQALRSMRFWWGKKGELLYRVTGTLRRQAAVD
jgi:UDP-MurNAc hydroxylase